VNSFKLYNFHADQWSVCDSVKQEEWTIVAGGVAWRLGVAVELMETTKSEVHESSTLGRIQGGGEYSPRWSLLSCVEY
jgi:hypothetical protein